MISEYNIPVDYVSWKIEKISSITYSRLSEEHIEHKYQLLFRSSFYVNMKITEKN